MSKLLASIKEAIEKCELRDGMTISFHHHMRNGDYVLNMVLDEIAKMGIKDLTVNASSVFDVHEPIIGHIKNGVVTGKTAPEKTYSRMFFGTLKTQVHIQGSRCRML